MKPTNQKWKNLTWDDLSFHIPGRMVLRHSHRLQYGYTIQPDQTLAEALLHMQNYCKAHPDGNPKITGVIKVIEHTEINNNELRMLLTKLINQGEIVVNK
jgi:hypothetical protein